jgi:hypothetical protein
MRRIVVVGLMALAPQLARAECVYTGAKRAYIECIYEHALSALNLSADNAQFSAGLQTQIDVLGGDVTMTASQVGDHQAALDALGPEVSSLGLRADAHESALMTLDGASSLLSSRADLHDTQLSALEQTTAMLSLSSGDQATQLGTLMVDVSTLGGRADGHDSHLMTIDAAVMDLDGRVDGHDTELSLLQSTLSVLSMGLDALSSALDALEGAVAGLDTRVDDHDADLSDLDDRVGDLEAGDASTKLALAGACLAGVNAGSGSFLATTRTAGQTCSARCAQAHSSAACAWGATFWTGGGYYGYNYECGSPVDFQQGSAGYYCCCRQGTSASPVFAD